MTNKKENIKSYAKNSYTGKWEIVAKNGVLIKDTWFSNDFGNRRFFTKGQKMEEVKKWTK